MPVARVRPSRPPTERSSRRREAPPSAEPGPHPFDTAAARADQPRSRPGITPLPGLAWRLCVAGAPGIRVKGIAAIVRREFTVVNLIKRFVAEEEGLELLEYAILGVVLAAGLVAAYTLLQGNISTGLGTAASTLTGS